MKNTSKFQNVVIVTIVGWLVLFVFLPNLMIIGTSFLTRDDASFVKMVFTLDNYTRLLDPLYFEVLLHSLNMALIATLACLVLGYPFAWFLAKLPHKVRPLLLFLLIVPFWTNSLIRIYGLKIFLSTKGYLNEFLLWLGVIDTPIRQAFVVGINHRFPVFNAGFMRRLHAQRQAGIVYQDINIAPLGRERCQHLFNSGAVANVQLGDIQIISQFVF